MIEEKEKIYIEVIKYMAIYLIIFTLFCYITILYADKFLEILLIASGVF